MAVISIDHIWTRRYTIPLSAETECGTTKPVKVFHNGLMAVDGLPDSLSTGVHMTTTHQPLRGDLSTVSVSPLSIWACFGSAASPSANATMASSYLSRPCNATPSR